MGSIRQDRPITTFQATVFAFVLAKVMFIAFVVLYALKQPQWMQVACISSFITINVGLATYVLRILKVNPLVGGVPFGSAMITNGVEVHVREHGQPVLDIQKQVPAPREIADATEHRPPAS